MVLGLVGIALVLFTVIEVYVTTLSMRGGGPLLSRLTDWLWHVAVSSNRASHRFLQVYGSLMLPLTLGLWTALLYAGWLLVFLGHPLAVVHTASGVPAGAWERVYFTGYVVSTLGNGDFRPGGTPWQLATVAAALTGLMLITLAITYVTPVLSAVVRKRQVATTIVGFGATPADILANGWDGRSFQPLRTHLANVVPELSALAQEHAAYPILHHFHAVDRTTALAPGIAVLDDALTLLRHGVADEHRLDPVTLRSATGAIGAVLGALSTHHLDGAPAAPDPPPLAILDRIGIPRAPDDDYAASTKGLHERRGLLLALIRSDGWAWPTDEPECDAPG